MAKDKDTSRRGEEYEEFMNRNRDKVKVLVISDRETFIAKAIQKNLRESGFDARFAKMNVSDISEVADETSVYVLYMDEDMKNEMKVMVYLKDISIEENKMILLIGSEEEYNAATKVIPKENLNAWFQRPFDMHAFIDEVKSLTDEQAKEERKKSILVVDDDVTFLRMVHSWLKKKFRVSIVTSGMQAITWLAKNEADLILLDYEMPVTSGPKVLEMLRSEAETSTVPVMFLTGKGDRMSILRVLDLKPADYLLKNIDRKQLLEKVDGFFKEKAATRRQK